jgi:hypothetical protein
MSTYPESPGHRGIDTSVAAADDLASKLGFLQRMVGTTIHRAGGRGLTTDELAANLGLNRWTVQPRTSELRRKGIIRDSGRRRPNATGRMAIVWIAAKSVVQEVPE